MEKDNNKKTAIVEVPDRGPLKITGNIYLKDIRRGVEESTSEVFLCLCGRSRNKPYCDDSHLN